MMSHQISVTNLAVKNMDSAATWFGSQVPDLGRRWRHGIEAAIESLRTNPDRCGLAHETDEFEFDLRELRYGVGRKASHRILFRVVAETVEILAVRHVAQQNLNAGTL